MPRSASVIVLPRLHAGQLEVGQSRKRYRVVVCGRRWGKTLLGSLIAVVNALQGKRVWWVAPTFPLSVVGWREVVALSRRIPGARVRKSERTVYFPGGGFVTVKSADREASLRSEGLDLVIIDEAAFIERESWEAELRPALADRLGRALFITTPNGLNWLHELFLFGGEHPDDWDVWQKPTSENPFIAASEIEEARTMLHEMTFRQEMLAEFVVREGQVFGDFRREVHAAKSLERERGLQLQLGVDFGYRTFAWVLVQVDKERTVRIIGDGEYKNLTTEQAVARLNQHDWANEVAVVACDPAGSARNLHSGITDVSILRARFPKARITYSTDTRHRDPEWRASRIRDLLCTATGRVSLYVDPKCAATMRMFLNSRYPKVTKGGGESGEPLKDGIVDHVRDALGYVVVAALHRQPSEIGGVRPW